MPRPPKTRWVEFYPRVTYFKPAGVKMRELEEVVLGVDEVEALRLKDLLGLEQVECADRMNLAQSTFQRILTAARQKVSLAIIKGKALRIEGGAYLIAPLAFGCNKCGNEWTNQDRHLVEYVCPACGSADYSVRRVKPEAESGGEPGAGDPENRLEDQRGPGPGGRGGRHRWRGGRDER